MGRSVLVLGQGLVNAALTAKASFLPVLKNTPFPQVLAGYAPEGSKDQLGLNLTIDSLRV